MELNPAKTPITVSNFMKYTNDGFYSNLIFHRVVKNFVVQGGGFTGAPLPMPKKRLLTPQLH